MTSLLTGFAGLQLNNRMNSDGARPYDECPELISGEVQRSCQSAFRQHMLNNTGIDDLLDAVASTPKSERDDREAVDIFIANVAFALSAPCGDYDDLLEYILEKFAELDALLIRDCYDTIRWILDRNPINPYLAFKNTSVENWLDLNEAFSVQDTLLQLAVIFDDAPMVEKISKSVFSRDFRKSLCAALAKTVFDPLSSVRSWAEMTTPSMMEVECRISRQAKALETTSFPLASVGLDISGHQLYKSAPEIGTQCGFYEGLYNMDSLAIRSKDHGLRYIPGYYELLTRYPEVIEDCLAAAMSDNPFMVQVLIEDLHKAGIPGHQILYKHIERRSPGEYLDKISSATTLTQEYVGDLLSLSGNQVRAVKAHGMAIDSLLVFVDPQYVDQCAKTDTQLRAAYAFTGEKRYLERMSEGAAGDQLGTDLGL
ncbi:hypothetical protein DV532_26770 (plasmid) [Pseudomonas sp. Leaf58]|uniref:hypothetical protein n=1 Tax=Pseudomonas sp. Leaf58 TaxID=1736226 RepID=UPI0006FAA69E|nr:hypothetical protein [Pseudomonas sp. Leaf58]AYG47890.1 hypothetical protein DV532_26770 [Pseudomonas sp. Leaf58]KQN62546.1 hypothetical protein ASF02_10390 [Pseudomonas sp. Leaf58]